MGFLGERRGAIVTISTVPERLLSFVRNDQEAARTSLRRSVPTSTRSAASLSLNALSSGFPSGSRPAPSATSETIVGLPSSAPPPRSLSARRNLTRSSSSLSGDSLANRRSAEGECQCWSAHNPRESRPAAQRARSARHRAHARRRLGLPARVPLPQRSAFTGEG